MRRLLIVVAVVVMLCGLSGCANVFNPRMPNMAL